MVNAAQPEPEILAQLAVSEGQQGLFFFQFCVVFYSEKQCFDLVKRTIHELGSCFYLKVFF
jgi:hypothetical protein